MGALLCREEATSDSACSTRLAAMEVACTEPGATEWDISRCAPCHLSVEALHHYSSVRQPCATVQGVKVNQTMTADFTDFHNFEWQEKLWKSPLRRIQCPLLSGVFGCSKKKKKKLETLSPQWHTVSWSCTKARPLHSTRCNTQCLARD